MILLRFIIAVTFKYSGTVCFHRNEVMLTMSMKRICTVYVLMKSIQCGPVKTLFETFFVAM